MMLPARGVYYGTGSGSYEDSLSRGEVSHGFGVQTVVGMADSDQGTVRQHPGAQNSTADFLSAGMGKTTGNHHGVDSFGVLHDGSAPAITPRKAELGTTASAGSSHAHLHGAPLWGEEFAGIESEV